jgi:hypothetical protein
VRRYNGGVPTRVLLLQSLLLAIVFTWPAALHPASVALGSSNGDGLKHVWNLWWMHRELWSGTWGLRTTLINFPAGIDLYPIEVSNGLLTAWLPLPPVLAANLLAMLHVALVGVCTGWLGWLVLEQRRGALAAGAIAQASAFTAFTLHAGVGELRQAWWVPLGLAFAVRAARESRLREFGQLGIIVAGATLACFYHGFFLATAVAVFAIAGSGLRLPLWRGWALAAGIVLAIVVPTMKVFSSTYGPASERPTVGFIAWMAAGLPKERHAVTSLTLLELVTPDGRLIGDPSVPFEAYLGGRYLGLLGLVLAAAGVYALRKRALPWLAIALVGVVLAFGNLTWWGGEGGIPLVMPMAVVNRALAYFAQPLNFPVRYLVITTTALAVLGGAATRYWWAALLAPLAIADVLVNDRVNFPRSTFHLQGADDVEAPAGAVAEITWMLKADPVAEGKVPLTLFDAGDRARSIVAQIYLDRPFETIPIERVDRWATDGIDWMAANAVARAARGTFLPRATMEDHLARLWRRGFRSVLITHDCVGRGDSGAIHRLDVILGEHVEGACLTLWPLRKPPLGAAPDADADAAYDAAVRGLPSSVSGAPVQDAGDPTRVGTGPREPPSPPQGRPLPR